jgi:ribosomal protein S18 acetylase RimI-like enzyme
MNQMKISIRKALSSDLEALIPLIEALDAHHVAIMPENFKAFDGPTRPVDLLEKKVASPDNALFIALDGDNVVGFVDIQKSANPPYPMFVQKDFALLDNLYVTPEFRGTGLAHTLFEKAKEWAKEQRFASVQLKVYNKNKGAIRFYEKEGLIPLSTTFEIEL